MAEIEHEFEIPAGVVGALAIGLVDHEHVGDLEQSRLVRLHCIAPAGIHDHDRGVGCTGDVDLDLTDADRLDQDRVESAGVEGSHRAGDRQCQAAGVAAGGDRADEAAVSGDIVHADPVAEDGATGER